MLSYVDHVSIAVRDIDRAIARFRDGLQFLVSKKREEAKSPLANSVIPLLQGYLELVSVRPIEGGRSARDQHDGLQQLNAFLAAREGYCGFAIQSSNLKADVESLQERGSRVCDPVHETLDDDADDGGWWTASLPGEADPAFPFLIQYDRPPGDRARQAGLSQPYSVRSIEEVTVIVPRLDSALEAYERNFGLKATRQWGGRAQLSLVGSKLNLIPARMAPLGTPLGLYSVGLGTTDINGARSTLRDMGITCDPAPLSWAVSAQIDPDLTLGALIDLVQL